MQIVKQIVFALFAQTYLSENFGSLQYFFVIFEDDKSGNSVGEIKPLYYIFIAILMLFLVILEDDKSGNFLRGDKSFRTLKPESRPKMTEKLLTGTLYLIQTNKQTNKQYWQDFSGIVVYHICTIFSGIVRFSDNSSLDFPLKPTFIQCN